MPVEKESTTAHRFVYRKLLYGILSADYRLLQVKLRVSLTWFKPPAALPTDATPDDEKARSESMYWFDQYLG